MDVGNRTNEYIRKLESVTNLPSPLRAEYDIHIRDAKAFKVALDEAMTWTMPSGSSLVTQELIAAERIVEGIDNTPTFIAGFLNEAPNPVVGIQQHYGNLQYVQDGKAILLADRTRWSFETGNVEGLRTGLVEDVAEPGRNRLVTLAFYKNPANTKYLYQATWVEGIESADLIAFNFSQKLGLRYNDIDPVVKTWLRDYPANELPQLVDELANFEPSTLNQLLADVRDGGDLFRGALGEVGVLRAWEALPPGLRTQIFWLEQTVRWFGHEVTFVKSGSRTDFKSPGGNLFAYIEGDELYYRYDGFGGDVKVHQDKSTLVLGKVRDDWNNPSTTQGLWRFLHDDRGFAEAGIPDGVISRVTIGESRLNHPSFLDMPDPEYYALINNSIKELIEAHPNFSNDLAALNLITDQQTRNGDVLAVVQDNNLLPGLSNELIDDLILAGVEDGNQIFWDTYNHRLLISAFERGDDIRLASDPIRNRDGVYARELQTIEDGSDEISALMTEFNYIYNQTTSTYEKQ